MTTSVAPSQLPPHSPFAPAEHAALRGLVPAACANVYLNAGFLGPIATPTMQAMQQRLEADVAGRFTEAWVEDLLRLQRDARSEYARLLHTEPGSIALMHATHDALGTLLAGLDLTGATLITTNEEHPGLLVPLRIATERHGATLTLVDIPATDNWHAQLCSALATAAHEAPTQPIVCLSHVSYRSGRELPLTQLRAALPDHALLVADGAQGAGALPIDATSLGAHAYTVSTHKWAGGPNHAGALYVADGVAVAPTIGGFGGMDDPFDPLGAPWASSRRTLEFAQESLLVLDGTIAALRFLMDDVGVERAATHSRALNAALRERLSSSTRVRATTGDQHLLVLDVPAGDAKALVASCAARGVVIRDLDARAIRISLGWWNTLDDLERLVAALHD